MSHSLSVQMSITQDGPPAVCLSSSTISDPLKQYMLLHLDLKHILQLAGTCTAWHQLITATSVHELSKTACQSLLPHGLTSELPLLELIKQQAQLLLRLRGKQAFSAITKHLCFDEELMDSCSDGSAPLQLEQLDWSTCTRLEDGSRWLLLESNILSPSTLMSRPPVIFNTQTGQHICFRNQAPGSELPGPSQGHSDLTDAIWITDNDGVLFHSPSVYRKFNHSAAASNNMRFADVQSQSICQLSLPKLSVPGKLKGLLIAACNAEGRDIFVLATCATSACASKCHEDQISVYDRRSQQLLYQLSCPGDARERFLQSYRQQLSRNQLAGQQEDGRSWELAVDRLELSPDTELLLAVWRLSLHKEVGDLASNHMTPDSTTGLSIHSFASRACQHSQALTARDSWNGPWGCKPSWLPGSSNLMYANSNGLHAITSTGQMLWSLPVSERSPAVATAQAHEPNDMHSGILTTPSPCGRWILAEDGLWDEGAIQNPAETYVSIVGAKTGTVLHRLTAQVHCNDQASWNQSGQVCLLPWLPVALIACKSTNASNQAFQQIELLCNSPSDGIWADVAGNELSLSPCGRSVIGMETLDPEGARIDRLQCWQLPSASYLSDPGFSSVAPAAISELTPYKPDFPQAAWHPLQGAQIFAIGSNRGGVCVIDAKANRCINSWNEEELHGVATASCPTDVPCQSALASSAVTLRQVLNWSGDGRRLAVASRATATSEAKCSVLQFADHIT